MPDNDSGSNHAISRRVAPFAPLALALLFSRAILPTQLGAPETETPTEVAAIQCDEVTDFQDCHSRYPTGCSQAAQYDAYLNLLKNQLISPDASEPVRFLAQKDFGDLDRQTPPELRKKNHVDFKDQLAGLGEGSTFGVIGYLYYAQRTGAESSNCQLPRDDEEGTNVDYHIGIGFDSDVAAGLRTDVRSRRSQQKMLGQNSVIVEMTPHYRFLYENGKWTYDDLQKVIGKQVKVVGQLLIDSEHNIPGQNCAIATTSKDKLSCWRASAWELHPVTRFLLCNNASQSCGPNSTDWVELDQVKP
jgi:hypothetical protein